MTKKQILCSALAIVTFMVLFIPFYFPDELVYIGVHIEPHYQKWFNIYGVSFIIIIQICFIQTLYKCWLWVINYIST